MLKHINDNACKLDLPREYGVSVTSNIIDLSPFDIGDDHDLRTNPSLEEGKDKDMEAVPRADISNDDSIKVLIGPITRTCAIKLRGSLQALVRSMKKQVGASKTIERFDQVSIKVINLLEVTDEDNSSYSSS